MRLITEQEFAERIREKICCMDSVGSVTGPGRSGAVAAVYASHILGIPFIPYGQPAPADRGSILVIDTAIESGKTLRKAERRYAEFNPVVIACYEEPPRVRFWYEPAKPQFYKHEKTSKG